MEDLVPHYTVAHVMAFSEGRRGYPPLAPGAGPVGYLVNHPAGLAGAQGIGYDYVLGAGGVYVQSRSAHLTARVLAAPCTVRGLAPVAEKVQLSHGPIPAALFAVGLRWFRDAPGTERLFAVRWDGRRYRLVVPPPGRDRNETRVPAPGGRGRRVPLAREPSRLLLGHRRPGRAGLPLLRRRRTPRRPPAGAASPGRGLRPLRSGGLAASVRRSGAGTDARHQSNDKEVRMPYHLDNAFLLDDPWITVVGCGGTGGFVAEGLCRLFQGREATIVLVDHDRVEPHNLLRQNFYPDDVGRFKSQALADRLARAYRRPVGYSVYPFRQDDSGPYGPRYPGLPSYGSCLLIGCADNAAARRAMAECLPGDPRRWLIDAGNDTNWEAGAGRQRRRRDRLGRTRLRRSGPATCFLRPRCSAPTC